MRKVKVYMAGARGRPVLEGEMASAVSIRANRTYRLALRELAARRNKSIADLVREACDMAYGHELTPLVNFFELSGLFKVQKDKEMSDPIVSREK